MDRHQFQSDSILSVVPAARPVWAPGRLGSTTVRSEKPSSHRAIGDVRSVDRLDLHSAQTVITLRTSAVPRRERPSEASAGAIEL